MAISGPIALYSNVPIHPDWYQPRRFVISNIILGLTTIIETTTDMDYVIGQQIRCLIPQIDRCQQINNKELYVISIPQSNQVEVNIDSRFFDPFMNISTMQQPQIVAIGDVNSGAVNTGRNNNTTYIYGSFINISPT